jgi:TonB family protein
VRKFWLVFLCETAIVFSQAPPTPNYLNEGVAAFKAGKYAQAIELFQQAVNGSPSDPTPHMYLAAAYVQQLNPGLDTPENQQLATNAERELQAVLGIQPDNMQAMQSLATLHYNRSQGKKDLSEKARALDDSAYWYRKITGAQPDHKIAHYSLGVIAWAKFYPELMQARTKLKMRPETPGPLSDAGMRADLRSRFGHVVEEGVRNLQRALEIDPAYDDAMAYLNLLYRERADLAESAADYQRDVQLADSLVKRALETKRTKAQNQNAQRGPQNTSVPPPPPPASGGPAAVPTQIRVGGAVQAGKLLDQPQPEYPPLALQARIQGTVRFTATILKDGTMGNLQLQSGHPLLAPSAVDAAKRYRYQPTLLNGEPVEVITELDVNFSLQ